MIVYYKTTVAFHDQTEFCALETGDHRVLCDVFIFFQTENDRMATSMDCQELQVAFELCYWVIE